MPYLYKTGRQYGVANVNIIGKASQELTQAQYNALSDAQKKDGTIYFVTDGVPDAVIVDDPAPIGAIMSYGGDTAPTGWLICDGSPVSRTVYSQLFEVIGETYGAGDGSTTFNVPDLKGRVTIGVDGEAEYGLGDTGGEEEHTLTINEIPSHNHPLKLGNGATPNWAFADGSSVQSFVLNGGTGYTGGGQAHNNMPPYIVTNYIIKAFDNSTSDSTLQSMTDYFYPVGSYYETSDSTFDPNVTFGGTWELETEGQVHISSGANYSVAGALTNTTDGGSKDAVVVSHTHKVSSGWQSASGQPDRITFGGVNGGYNNTGYGGVQFIESVGVDGTNKNLQPYIVVNRWHRIA